MHEVSSQSASHGQAPPAGSPQRSTALGLVLVTGGGGYIGSVLSNRLVEAGHRIRIFDRFLFGEDVLDPIANLPGVQIVRGDVRRLQEHPNLFSEVVTVIHLAGIADERSCERFEAMARDVNVASTLELARKAAEAGVRRFIFASVAGGGDTALGRQKAEAERGLLAMATESFQPIVVRLGPLGGVSPRMRLDLAGSQQSQLKIVHVKDAAEGILFAANSAMPPGPAICTLGEENSANDAVRLQEFGFQPTHAIVNIAKEIESYLRDRRDTSARRYSNEETIQEIINTPVEEGGEPIAPQFIPLARPVMDEEEEQAVLDTFRSGWITSGPKIGAFEKAFAETVQAPHCIATISCTAALHLGLVESGVQAGDEVITTPITWPSTGNTILNMGARPVFVDVEPDTLNIDAAKIEAAITKRTKAIMPVHLAGQPCDIKAINTIAARHGIAVVEDAAHALGATYGGRVIGRDTRLACFSFYAIKNITTIEGGAITTNDAAIAQRLRVLASNGMSATAWDRYGRSAAPGPAEVVLPGYKYLMGNVSAAMGLVQLRKWPAFKAQRERLANRYVELLRNLDDVHTLAVRPGRGHSWHLMIVRFDSDRLSRDRDQIAQALRMENIGSGVHFLGLHLHQYYREQLGIKPESLPIASKVSREILSLPLHPAMTEGDVELVVLALKRVLSRSH